MSESTPQLPDPVRGGSYLRDPETGELQQLEGIGEPVVETAPTEPASIEPSDQPAQE